VRPALHILCVLSAYEPHVGGCHGYSRGAHCSSAMEVKLSL